MIQAMRAILQAKGKIGEAGGFPNPKPCAIASLDMDDYPSFEEDEAGSSQWLPRKKSGAG